MLHTGKNERMEGKNWITAEKGYRPIRVRFFFLFMLVGDFTQLHTHKIFLETVDAFRDGGVMTQVLHYLRKGENQSDGRSSIVMWRPEMWATSRKNWTRYKSFWISQLTLTLILILAY